MTAHRDLKEFDKQSDWYATIVIPTPSNLDHAQDRFQLEWHHARAQLSDRWGPDEIAELDAVVSGLRHSIGAALVIVHAQGGATLIEPLDEPVAAPTVYEGPLPRWATVIEARQRVIPHVVVEADRAGADIVAFDGGTVLATEIVEGDTEYIHRGHPGGWSQRRYQQRAENTWEDNARDVAAVAAELAGKVGAELVAVAGDVRAQGFVLDHLPTAVRAITVKIDAGSPEGIADELVRRLSTITAERITAAAEQVRARLEQGLATVDADAVMSALREGRVETLLVHDANEPPGPPDDATPGRGRLVDQAIVAALATDAEILVVPSLAMMNGPVAATLRW
ncbi:MAG: Vms1/Ankzf1 family peptidyl-tRNA hydrolase [Acidimicrobiia bacterium]